MARPTAPSRSTSQSTDHLPSAVAPPLHHQPAAHQRHRAPTPTLPMPPVSVTARHVRPSSRTGMSVELRTLLRLSFFDNID